jgi:hypothetical protein
MHATSSNNDLNDPDPPTYERLVVCCALPLLTSAAVLAYVYACGGGWTSDVAYAVCVAALVAAVVLASGVQFDDAPLVALQGRLMSAIPPAIEGFFDGAKTITEEVLMPKIDRLVLGLMGKNADGSMVDSAPGLTEDEANDPMINITIARFKDDVQGQAGELVQDYSRIAYMFCRLAEAYPEEFKQIMARL